MRLSLLLAFAALAAGSAVAEPAVKVAVFDLKPRGVPEELAATLNHVFVDELLRGGGISLISKSDMREILKLEEARMLLGCPSTDESCMMQHGKALGDAILVWGEVGKVADRIVISAAAIDVRAEKTIGRKSITVSAQDGDAMIEAARDIAEQLRVELGLESPASWKPVMAAVFLAGGSAAGTMGSGGKLDTWQTSVEAELDVFIIEQLAVFLKVGFSFGGGKDQNDEGFTAYLVPAVVGAKWRWIRDWATPYIGAGVGFGFLDMDNQGGMLELLGLAGMEIAPPKWRRVAFAVEGGLIYQRPLKSRDLSRIGGRLCAGLIYRF